MQRATVRPDFKAAIVLQTCYCCKQKMPICTGCILDVDHEEIQDKEEHRSDGCYDTQDKRCTRPICSLCCIDNECGVEGEDGRLCRFCDYKNEREDYDEDEDRPEIQPCRRFCTCCGNLSDDMDPKERCGHRRCPDCVKTCSTTKNKCDSSCGQDETCKLWCTKKDQ